MARVHGFNERDAKRISRTVHHYEKIGQYPQPSRQRSKYPVGGGSFRFRWATLTEALTSGSTANAQFKRWDSGTSAFVEDTGFIKPVRAKFTFDKGPVPIGTEITVFKQHGVWWIEDTNWCPETV